MYEEKTSVDPVFPIKWCYQIDRHIQDYLTACSMDPPDLSLSAKILLRFGNDCESLEARLWNSGSVPKNLIHLLDQRREMHRSLPPGLDEAGRSHGWQSSGQPPAEKRRVVTNENRDGRFSAIYEDKLHLLTRNAFRCPKNNGVPICLRYHVLGTCDTVCTLTHLSLNRQQQDELAEWVSESMY
jgi:hypothetical protein